MTRRPAPRPRPPGAANALAAGLCALLAACAPPAGPPNVLLVSLDSVRADDLDFADESRAPRLAELARRGTVFTQAVAGSSWTLPTHAQLFTGLPPAMHGVHWDDLRIDPRTPTLPELFAEAGWHTRGFYTGWYVHPDFGFGRGFGNAYENAMTHGRELDRRFREAIEAGRDDEARALVHDRNVESHRDVTSPNVLQRARAHLARIPEDEPVLFFCHFFDPHYDYVPPPPYDERFDPGYDGPIDGREYWTDRRIFDPTKTPPRRISDRDLAHVRALYRGEILWTDRHVGELLDAFEEAGRLENTIVVVLADHGEEFFEHGNRGHRQSLYDEVLRVPLCVVPPARAREGLVGEVGAQVSLSDVLPTLLDLAGLPAPEGVHGRSLAPAMRGEPLEPRPVVASLVLFRSDPADPSRSTFLRQDAVRTPETKLVRTTTASGSDAERAVARLEYFDLASDPLERRPITDPADPRVRAGWDALEAEMARLREAWDALPHAPTEERRTSILDLLFGDAERELEALGYLEPGEEAIKDGWGVARDIRPTPPLEYPSE